MKNNARRRRPLCLCSRPRNTQASVRAKFHSGGSLRGEERGQQVVDATDTREKREQSHVDHEPRESNGAEAGKARSSLEPQLAEVDEIASGLGDGSLATAGEPLSERERNLCSAKVRRADEDLEQDLEAVRLEPVDVDRVAPHEEEPAHRIADSAQPPREAHASHGRRDLGERGADHPEASSFASRGIAACDDEVDGLILGSLEQILDELRGMLQIAVHDARPGSARPCQAVHDGSAQATPPLAGRAVDDGNAPRLVNTQALYLFSRPVAAVVDKDDLRRHSGRDIRKPRKKRPDVLDFVLCRHDDR